MTQFVIVPFYCGPGPQRPGDPVEIETRVTGRVPRDYKQSRLDYSIISPKWDLGVALEADTLAGLVAQCDFGYRNQQWPRFPGQTLLDRNPPEQQKDPTTFIYHPDPPPPGRIQLIALGPVFYEGAMREAVALIGDDGLNWRGTEHFKADGFYHEDVAFARASHPEFVTFIFERMRKLGYDSSKEATP